MWGVPDLINLIEKIPIDCNIYPIFNWLILMGKLNIKSKIGIYFVFIFFVIHGKHLNQYQAEKHLNRYATEEIFDEVIPFFNPLKK